MNIGLRPRLLACVLLLATALPALADSIDIQILHPDGTPVDKVEIKVASFLPAKNGGLVPTGGMTLFSSNGRALVGPLTAGRYQLVFSKTGHVSTQVGPIDILSKPNRSGVDKIVVIINPLVTLSPYENTPPN